MRNNKTLLLSFVAILLLFGIVFATESANKTGSTLTLEINNQLALEPADIVSLDGASYAESFKLSKALGLDFYSLNGGEILVLREVKDGKETFVYFENLSKKPAVPVTEVLSDPGNPKNSNIKLVNNLTAGMYGELEAAKKVVGAEKERAIGSAGNTEKTVKYLYYYAYNGDTYLPVKQLVEALGYTVKYDPRSDAVLVYTVDESTLPKRKVLRMNYTEDELNTLAKLVTLEAGGNSMELQIAVANVVLNRVENPRFPNTIKEVIFQSGQFPPAHRASFATLQPKDSAIEAATRALYGENNVPNVLFFNYVPFPSKPASSFFGTIDGEYFYY